MATLNENRAHWASYAWPEGGEEWSKAWGDPRLMWFGTIYPRIALYVVTPHVLEIACGYGRVSGFLEACCERLTLVDMTEQCIEACRKRFGAAVWDYIVNDGRSLFGVADASIDFAFSWDSLVHADAETMASYVAELSRVLRPGGAAFLHHSNLADCLKPSAHWRDPSMSAELLREYAADASLHVLAQELVMWEPGVYSDCFSLLGQPRPGEAIKAALPSLSPDFGDEVARCRRLSALYWADR